MAQLVTNRKKLSVPCESITDIIKAEEIAVTLFDELSKRPGYGLSANQIGIDATVCVVHVDEPYALIYPVIRKSEGQTLYQEQCLSFSGITVVTQRNIAITVDADNLDESLVLDPFIRDKAGKPRTDANGQARLNQEILLESVVVQHEIDHLNGVTIFDRKYVRTPLKATPSIGRNERVKLKHPTTDATIEIKYKRATSLLDLGWTLQAA